MLLAEEASRKRFKKKELKYMYFYCGFVFWVVAYYISFFVNLLSGWQYFTSEQFMKFWTGKNGVTVAIVFAVGGTLLVLLKKHAPAEYEKEKVMIMAFIFTEVFTNLAFIYQEIGMLSRNDFMMADKRNRMLTFVGFRTIV
jgi:hypothetical protein